MFLEFRDWPASVIDLCMARPVFSVAVAYHVEGGTINLFPEGPLDFSSDEALFPKLGPKSWRDNGRVRPVLLDGISNERTIISLLRTLSPQQAYTTRCIVRNDAPLFLYFFPWIDFTNISEFRFMNSNRTGTTRLLSQANRIPDSCIDMTEAVNQCAALSRTVGAEFDCEDIVVDIGLTQTGDMRLIEVNPAGGAGSPDMLKVSPC